LRNGRRLLREIREFRPDVFITAYEPFTMIASHLVGRPLISMDNQNELRDLPRPKGANLFAFHLARLATLVATYGAADYIVKSFSRREVGTGKMHYVAPIIQGEIRRMRVTIGSHVLVYLTKPNPELIEVLKSMDGTFIVYCHNRVGEDQNILYRAQGENFVRDLASCRAIIATAGFSLIADSIFLRKPYFAVPLRKQFEQTHNAHFLGESGLGEYSEIVTREKLEGFLARLPGYREKLDRYDFDPAEQEETLRMLLARMEGRRAADPGTGVRATCPET
ncbi:MAG TPA: glycosyltransferase family protein, partial [Planctomycetota bacterium]|nr:glycosyltransferase family protein [Planctomycetota bacterium]